VTFALAAISNLIHSPSPPTAAALKTGVFKYLLYKPAREEMINRIFCQMKNIIAYSDVLTLALAKINAATHEEKLPSAATYKGDCPWIPQIFTSNPNWMRASKQTKFPQDDAIHKQDSPFLHKNIQQKFPSTIISHGNSRIGKMNVSTSFYK
jgi:hypothetical protein